MSDNQPIAFAALGIGAILLTSALTGNSLGDILKGHFGNVSSSPATNGVAGVGAGVSSVITGSGTINTPTVHPVGGGKLNSDQATFAAQLAKDTGLSLAVVQGWVLSEEPASASQAPNGANNWLNVGAFTGGNWAGGGASVWNNPITAANATASFITGKTVNGVKAPLNPAGSILSIAEAAGKGISAQISAIQNSGWASSGYPNLASVVNEFL